MGLKPKTEREILKHENERYYIPVDTHVEIHTCVGIICAVLQHVTANAALLVGLVALSVLLLIRKQRRTNKKHKKAYIAVLYGTGVYERPVNPRSLFLVNTNPSWTELEKHKQ